jgi:hypothetical protein
MLYPFLSLNSKTKFLNNPALMSAATGLLLSLLFGLWFYAYRTVYVANLLEFYSNSAIHSRVVLIEYAMTVIGLVIGAQLFGAKWWTGGLVLLANSLLLPWLVVLLSEDVFMAPEYSILFFLPIWLSLRLVICQLLGLFLITTIKKYQNLTFN